MIIHVRNPKRKIETLLEKIRESVRYFISKSAMLISNFSVYKNSVQFSSVTQSCTTLCDLMTAARQASLSTTNSRSLVKLMSIESVMPSNHLILCHPLLFLPPIFPSLRSFLMSRPFISGGQNTGASASASVLPMNTFIHRTNRLLFL